jgi:hypothetical protein
MYADDETLVQAADDFYRALNRYYSEPCEETLRDLVTLSIHYRTLGCKISLVKEGKVVRVERMEAQCQPSL